MTCSIPRSAPSRSPAIARISESDVRHAPALGADEWARSCTGVHAGSARRRHRCAARRRAHASRISARRTIRRGSRSRVWILQRLVEHAAGIVILDEAYAEFADDGWIAEAPRHPRLIVTRTMSKAFGLAGLRIGYAAAAASTITQIEKARGPYMVSGVGGARRRSPRCATISNGCATHVVAARENPRRVSRAELECGGNSVLAIRRELRSRPGRRCRRSRGAHARRRCRGAAIRRAPRDWRRRAHHRRAMADDGDRAARAPRMRCAHEGERVRLRGRESPLARQDARARRRVASRSRPIPPRAARADVLVLPGVGAFGHAAARLAPGRDRHAQRLARRAPVPRHLPRHAAALRCQR